MTSDVPGEGKPQQPEEGSDSAAWSIEDFDNFDAVDELTPPADSEPAVEPQPDAAEPAVGEETVDDDDGQPPVKPIPFQPGFEFDTEGDVVADGEVIEFGAPDEQPGFGELWASPSEQEDDFGALDDGEAGLVPPAAPARGADDADVTTEFVPPGVDAPGAVEASAGQPSANASADAPPYDHEAVETERPDEITAERLDEITAERLYSTSTQEYAGLAEHVARAADEDQELMAVAADMPGLERGVVGLDDVVEASGVEATPPPARRSSDLPLRIGTAILLLAVFIGSLYRPLFLGILAVIVLGLAAGEFYTVLVRARYNPLTVFGLAGVLGAMIGTWIFGPVAIPMSLGAALLLTLIFYTVVSGRSLPLFNAALTMMVAVWVGLGAFVFDMLESPDFRWLIVAFIVTVAFMDICQYFVGRRLGRTPLAPRISPKKTVEGLVGGVLGALFVGVFFGLFESGPFDLGSGLLLGLIVAAIAPFGDLAISVVKRSLEVKDMGTILPGHGGVLDRIDAMLIVVPVVWVAYAWLGLLN